MNDPLLHRCEKERDEAKHLVNVHKEAERVAREKSIFQKKRADAAEKRANRLAQAVRAFLTAYHHDIGFKDEVKALERALEAKR